jgi:hypothetical protein
MSAAAVDPQLVVERLNSLADVLARQAPTRCNIELTAHIEGVYCDSGGSVVVRMCSLGCLAGGVELLASTPVNCGTETSPGHQGKARSRRLPLRKLTGADAASRELAELAESTTDVNRFAGLGPEWFWRIGFRSLAVRPGPGTTRLRWRWHDGMKG